jgi:hypothetical protein
VSDELKMNKEIKETEDLIEKNFDQARALADRRDFFTLSLVFTILALAIQTADFGEQEFQKFLEALAWIFFLVSGISALLRVRMSPVYYFAMGHRESYKGWAKQLKEYRGEVLGQSSEGVYEMSTEERLKRASKEEKHAVLWKERAEVVSKQGSIQHEVHFWCLLVGLILLGVSRAWVNLAP